MVRGKTDLKTPEVLLDLVDRISEGVYISNNAGDFLDGNPALLAILGLPSMEALRQTKVFELLDPQQRNEQVRLLQRDGSIRDFEIQVRRPDGEIRWALDSAYAVKDPATGEITYRGILRDITFRKRLEGQLLEQSVRDPLTGCFNRRHLHEFEQKMYDQPWGCLVIDVDHFKHYNDTYGHLAGDQVLIRISRFLMRVARADASVVRMGGDEFLLLLPNAGLEQTEVAADRIHQAALVEAAPPFTMGHAAREFKESLEKTIHRADQNLYEVRTMHRSPDQERRKPM